VNGTGAKDAPRTPNDGERVPRTDVFSGLGEQERRVLLEWVGENMPGLRRSAYGQRILYSPDRLHRWPGRLYRWIRPQVVGDHGAPWVCG
jgi:hypothetical protein